MDIGSKAFIQAVEQIAYEKKIPVERILETVEAALAAAYRKDFGHPEQQVRARLNKDTGGADLFTVYQIVEEVENPHTELTVAQAKEKGLKDPKVGDEYTETVDPPDDYGRIAAQTAKQVIIQRIREVEREIVQEEFADRTGELMTGSVQRIEGRNVFVEIGRALGVLGPEDKIDTERYYIGQRLRVLLREVDSEGRGAQLILTRAHPDFVRRLFELEVPEIHAGTVEIRSIAREAGVRTKVAVHSNQQGVDPVGTCVGQRGTRVQAIMAELGEEKIDIVLYSDDPVQYIMNALSPAKISRIDLDEKTKTACIHVGDDQLSLAIGRGGQNVRLAGDLTGWQLDIDKSEQGDGAFGEVVAGTPLEAVPGLAEAEVAALSATGLETAQAVAGATPEQLRAVEGVTDERLSEIAASAKSSISEAAADDQSTSAYEPPDASDVTGAENTTTSPKSAPDPAEPAAPDDASEDTDVPAADAETAPGTAEAGEEPATSQPESPDEPADSTSPEGTDESKPA